MIAPFVCFVASLIGAVYAVHHDFAFTAALFGAGTGLWFASFIQKVITR